MALRIIIDGYNLMNCNEIHHQLSPLPSFQAQRDALLQMLSLYQKRRLHEITVIFDAHHSVSRFAQKTFVGGVQVIYTPVGETADDMIVSMPKGDHASLVVISSDHHISGPLSAQDYVVISSEEFVKCLLPAIASPAAPSSFDKEEEEAGRRVKGKGPSHRQSKEQRRLAVILKKL